MSPIGKKTLRGLIPALAVPFTADGSLDQGEFEEHVRSVGQVDGVTGVAVNGHAGELASLSERERLELVRLSRAALPPDRLVIAGVDAHSTAAAQEALRANAEAGADAVLVLPPFDTMARRTLSKSTAAALDYFGALNETGVPMVVFQYPRATGCDYTTETLGELAAVDNVVAVKNAVWHTELYVEQYFAVRDTVSVLAACDAPELLAMMMVGADGLLLGASTVGTEYWAQYVTDLRNGSYAAAREVFVARLVPVLEALFGATKPRSATFAATTKYALQQVGAFSRHDMRRPEIEPDAGDKQLINEALSRAGLTARPV